jgi:hypothetical protein
MTNYLGQIAHALEARNIVGLGSGGSGSGGSLGSVLGEKEDKGKGKAKEDAIRRSTVH